MNSSVPGSSPVTVRVAIVGAGPAGFYAAESLLKRDLDVTVDMFEKLPAPYGLVRYGVAPDHAKIKNVTRAYDRIASNERFRYFGNVEFGRDIILDDLQHFYDAIVFSVGAESDRKLGIPGEDLPGSHTATEFVAWYNAHPAAKDREFDFSGEDAIVIGQGNVAVDVVRILAKTVDELKQTDIASYALEQLAGSKIKRIHMVGRRGPVQAAFTKMEIKELGELPHCDLVFANPEDFHLTPESQAELDDPANSHGRANWEILNELRNRKPSGRPRQIIIHFFRSPVELIGDNTIQKVILGKNRLEGEPGRQRAHDTGAREELSADIFFRSVGYRGVPLPSVPFDDRRGIIPNDEGRIVLEGKPIPGLYVSGWIKRGPSGLIGTNKPDSVATVDKISEDLGSLPRAPERNPEKVREFLASKNVRYIDYEDWKRIDQIEIERGKQSGKIREKFTSVEEMLEVLG